MARWLTASSEQPPREKVVLHGYEQVVVESLVMKAKGIAEVLYELERIICIWKVLLQPVDRDPELLVARCSAAKRRRDTESNEPRYFHIRHGCARISCRPVNILLHLNFPLVPLFAVQHLHFLPRFPPELAR